MRLGDYEHRAQERFWSKVDKSGGPDACWPWTASLQNGGYGEFWYRGGRMLAHRFAAGAAGPTPGLEACHSCGNRLCCNPAHLRLDTSKENQQDKILHGTSNRGERNGNRKLTVDDVRSIRREHATGDVSRRELSEKYGISHQQVSHIVNRKSWNHV